MDADVLVVFSLATELPSLRKHKAYESRSGKEAGVLIPTISPTAPDIRVEDPAVDVSPGFKLSSRCPLEQKPLFTEHCLSCGSGKMNAVLRSCVPGRLFQSNG